MDTSMKAMGSDAYNIKQLGEAESSWQYTEIEAPRQENQQQEHELDRMHQMTRRSGDCSLINEEAAIGHWQPTSLLILDEGLGGQCVVILQQWINAAQE